MSIKTRLDKLENSLYESSYKDLIIMSLPDWTNLLNNEQNTIKIIVIWKGKTITMTISEYEEWRKENNIPESIQIDGVNYFDWSALFSNKE